METKIKVEDITRYSVDIIRVFMDALEKFDGDYLFGKAELAYMHDAFGLWLKANEEAIVRLNGLLDADGLVTDEKVLTDLYHEMKGIYQQAKSFENAFGQFCGQRKINGVTAVKALFETGD